MANVEFWQKVLEPAFKPATLTVAEEEGLIAIRLRNPQGRWLMFHLPVEDQAQPLAQNVVEQVCRTLVDDWLSMT